MKKLFVFLASLATLTMFAAPALAIGAGNWGLDTTADKSGYTVNGKTSDTAEVLIARIVTAVLSILAILFFALMLYGGIRWMTARGNEEFVLKAKNIVEAAIIGLVLVMGSAAITQFVLKLANK